MLIAEPIPHPKRPLVRPHDAHHFFAADGRAGTGSLILRHADTVEHHFHAICGGGGGVCRGSRTTTSFCPQRELPLARLVIYRQTPARAVRARHKETLGVQPRSGILALISTQQHWLYTDNGRAPQYQRAPRGGCSLGGGGGGWGVGRHSPVHRVLCSKPLRLRTHRPCGRSWPLRSAVVRTRLHQ